MNRVIKVTKKRTHNTNLSVLNSLQRKLATSQYSFYADQIIVIKDQQRSPSVLFASLEKTFSGMFGIIGSVLRSVSSGSI
jgi:hypothetical protein